MTAKTGRTRRKVLAIGAALTLQAGVSAGTPALAGQDRAGVDAMAAGRELVDADEFTGSALDKTRWGTYDGNSSNGISSWKPSELSVGDGELRINGRGKDPTGAGNVSGALCWCLGKGDQTYGLWMVRAKFDPGKGYGAAMLLWPKSNVWPQDGELDIVESVRPQRISALSSVHWGEPPNGERDSGKLWGDYTQWHVYAVDWQPDYVKFSIDGQTVYDTRYSTKKPAIPNKPMHLVMQQDPGPYGAPGWIPAPDETTPDNVAVHVDWVRMYR
ncbi:glycoside hydrolase family 16 protein [Amycolatopsis nigrescens]|uniref:glycoside hydrolase family 16 protein n=1 Tax=Amycolatopsis nigrescens TaxID=381445 RepID=UPI000369014F|nr:glycoside hydrolase family 16 protein [Amycolatopsis nigrescens]